MTTRRTYAVLAAVLLVTSTAQAGTADYARGLVLEAGDDSVVQRLAIPADVYEWVTRADLGDLRVFNEAGEEVPYNLRRPGRTDEFSPWQTLPLFPLPDPAAAGPGETSLRIEVDDTGAIVQIGETMLQRLPTGRFLVDASSLEHPATQMHVDWQTDNGADFVGRIRVEASDDLNEWQTLVQGTAIAGLAQNTGVVRLDQFELPRTGAGYLRISQLEGSEPVRLTEVRVRHREAQLPMREWKTLNAAAVDDGFEFHSGGRFPIDRVALVHPDDTTSYLVTVELFSRNAPEDAWRPRGTRTFYRSNVAGVAVASDPIRYADPDQYWRAVFEGEPPFQPALRIGWLPDELLFLKQGSAPYVLAYGSAGVTGRQWPLRQLLSQLGGPGEAALTDVPFARVGEPELLGGPDRLRTAEEPVDWRTIILWAVLVIGVLAVGGLAIRLLKGA